MLDLISNLLIRFMLIFTLFINPFYKHGIYRDLEIIHFFYVIFSALTLTEVFRTQTFKNA